LLLVITVLFGGCDLFGGDGTYDGTEDGEDDGTDDGTDGTVTASVADTAIFSIPAPFTGEDSTAAREITQSTMDTIDGFFGYARYQIWYADTVIDAVKSMIMALETAEVFEATESFTMELSGTSNAGDIVEWTVGADETYLLEWWKLQADSSFLKYLELQFDEYEIEDGTLTVAGSAIAYIPANDAITLFEGFQQNGEWVMVDFDSDSDDAGTAWMKVSVTGFLANNLDPVEAGGDADETQCCIIEISRDSEGSYEIVGCTWVPGTSHLTFSESEYENRYYLYTGVGTTETATMNLGMPADEYETATAFDTDAAIGGVIKEWYADYLRDEAVDDYDTSVLKILADYSLITITGSVSIDPANPPTADIYDAIDAAYTANSSLESWENALYLMEVENPVYFEAGGYIDFGAEAPEGYPATGDLPALDVTQNEIDTLIIAFSSPGDTPPGLTAR